jgi:hypothetical protein
MRCLREQTARPPKEDDEQDKAAEQIEPQSGFGRETARLLRIIGEVPGLREGATGLKLPPDKRLVVLGDVPPQLRIINREPKLLRGLEGNFAEELDSELSLVSGPEVHPANDSVL